MVTDLLLIDMVAFILFIAIAVGYHMYYLVLLGDKHRWAVRSRMHQHRRNWMEMVQKRGERIMAVQTLRNIIMTNTFLASTMILLVAFISNFVLAGSNPVFEHPNPNYFTGAMPLVVKATVLLILYAFAFVMFTSSLRTLNHLSILISVDPDQLQAVEQRSSSGFLGEKINSVETNTTYGHRAVYFSLPIFAWFFSPWLFAVMTVGMWLYFVFVLDFAKPDEQESEEKRGVAATPAPSTSR